jgi:hypothetical protein
MLLRCSTDEYPPAARPRAPPYWQATHLLLHAREEDPPHRSMHKRSTDEGPACRPPAAGDKPPTCQRCTSTMTVLHCRSMHRHRFSSESTTSSSSDLLQLSSFVLQLLRFWLIFLLSHDLVLSVPITFPRSEWMA